MHEKYIKRCLELAQLGFGFVHPNPMVGAVIVHGGEVIGEGYHMRYGGAHAEVEALKTVKDTSLLKDSIMYVSLEPCNHTGKTPPCSEAIIHSGIKTVVIGVQDPNPKVSGAGLERLRQNGVEVITPVLEDECREINKRFFTFHEKKRPYIILKWAQTADGFIAKKDYSSKWISGEKSRELVHQWRAQEMGVLVGTQTAVQDNPHLTARIKGAKNPFRILIDRELRIPTSFHVFDEAATTLLFNAVEDYSYPAATLIKIDFTQDIIPQILRHLYERGVQSVIIEGGTKTIQSFIDLGLWDKARVFTAQKRFGDGIPAPRLPSASEIDHFTCGEDRLVFYVPSKP